MKEKERGQKEERGRVREWGGTKTEIYNIISDKDYDIFAMTIFFGKK